MGRDPRVDPRAGDAVGFAHQNWIVAGVMHEKVYYRTAGSIWFLYHLDLSDWPKCTNTATVVHVAEG